MIASIPCLQSESQSIVMKTHNIASKNIEFNKTQNSVKMLNFCPLRHTQARGRREGM
jgi:hypothetical protein